MKKTLWLAVVAVVAAGAVVGFTRAQPRVVAQRDGLPPGVSHVDVDVAYVQLSFDELARQADEILVGKVLDVSPTLWNQDSGEYWEETIRDAAGLETIETALPYYEVRLQVLRPVLVRGALAGRIAASEPVVVTAVGMSPLDDPDTVSAAGVTTADGAMPFAPGSTVAVFAGAGEIAWRGGAMRPVLQLLGDPAQSVRPIGAVVEGRSATTDAEAIERFVARVKVLRGAVTE